MPPAAPSQLALPLLQPCAPHPEAQDGCRGCQPATVTVRDPLGGRTEWCRELCCDRARPVWTCVGNECPDTMGVDIRDWLAAAVERAA